MLLINNAIISLIWSNEIIKTLFHFWEHRGNILLFIYLFNETVQLQSKVQDQQESHVISEQRLQHLRY